MHLNSFYNKIFALTLLKVKLSQIGRSTSSRDKKKKKKQSKGEERTMTVNLPKTKLKQTPCRNLPKERERR